MAESRPNQAYYPDGEPIPDDKLGEALNAGVAQYPADKTIVVQKYGQRFNVTGGEVWDYIRDGYTPEAPEETITKDLNKEAPVGERLKAGVEGFTSLVSPLVGEIGGPDYRLAARRRAQGLPGTRAAGEFASLAVPLGGELKGLRGVVAGLTTTGGAARAVGTGAVRLAEQAAPQLMAKSPFLRGAVRYGAEGVAVGSTQEISRSYLMDEEQSAERIFAAGAMGGLFGGATGGVISSGFKRLSDKIAQFSERSAPGKPLSSLEIKALQSAGIKQSQVATIGVDRARKMSHQLLDRKLIQGEDALLGRAERVEAAKDGVGSSVGDIYAARGVLTYADRRAILQRPEKLLADEAAKGGEYAAAADKIKNSFIGKMGLNPNTRRLAFDGPLYTAPTWESLWRVEQDIRKKAFGAAGSEKLADEMLYKFRQELKAGVRDRLETLDSDAAARLRALDDEYSVLDGLAKLMKPRAQGSSMEAGGFQPWEAAVIAGSVATGSQAGIVYGLSRRGQREWRENPEVAAALIGLVDKVNTTAVRNQNTIAGAVAKQAGSAVKHSIRALPPRVAATIAAYNERRGAVQQAEMQPERLAARVGEVTAAIAETSPVLASTITRTAVDDLAWLNARLPRAPQALPVAKGEKISPAEIPTSEASRFVRSSRVLGDVTSEILKIGTKRPVAPETADVLRERRPIILGDVTQAIDKLVMDLAAKGKLLPYSTRVQVSSIVGNAYDFSMRPEYVAFTQERYRLRREQEAAGAPPSGGARRKTPEQTRERSQQLLTGAQENMLDKE